MPPKRTRKAAEADASKTSMEDAAEALAGVEGALKTTTTATGKRKASGTAAGKRPAKKTVAKRDRSNSMEQLTEVAASLLADPTDEDLSVPNPMATAAAAAAAAPAPMPSLPAAKNGGEQPTGFRKKPAARPKAAAKKETKSEGTEEGKKTQIQYNPDVPMSKEQLTAWRREMRRVRNRESAAASRRKVRDRIQELEEEVKGWKDRYEEVMARLSQAEGVKKEEDADV
ncbi:hypothetical protein ACHAWT_002849 [Skeletonema menzelii]|mmetsp:Transcript_11139/g.18362  ORF Transcript_11139/g.18362 Transcript_11139/m.18362 type:complete len:228 (+) Transcript_11139:236-919(+)